MRYYFRERTLLIRGRFRAASTGVNGGLGCVSTLMNLTVPPDWDHSQPGRVLEERIAELGLPPDFFGLMTAVPIRTCCIMQYDHVTCFVTAGVTHPDPVEAGNTINIIVHSARGLTDAALLESIVTVTEAKALALGRMGYEFAGTTTDGVIVACEGAITETYGGSLTGVGHRIHESVLFGVREALERQLGKKEAKEPALFIFSRYGGEHWVQWSPVGCTYYPCHFKGQSCDFCYCPFYPCLDRELGTYVESSLGGQVWSCSGCRLVHLPEIAAYLKRNPEATLLELKSRERRLKKG